MDDNVVWVFQKKDVQRPRACPQCGQTMQVSWHGNRYDYGCENFACPQMYAGPTGPSDTDDELDSDADVMVSTPNCPRCLMPMGIVPDGDAYKFACEQDGCDGIWPPIGS